MMNNIPDSIDIMFMLTTLLSIAIFYRASGFSKTLLYILLGWIGLQGVLSYSGFYLVTDSIPPRFILLVFFPVLCIVILFLTARGKRFIESLDLKTLTILHIVRIPVELVLYWLAVYKAVPELMTFEGRNFDILSGLSAPIIYYFGFVNVKLSRRMIMAWNIICLGLLVNIVVNAFLSAPFPFQQFAFDQPNVAVLYFPYAWLPCCVVQLVLLSHLASIYQLSLPEANK